MATRSLIAFDNHDTVTFIYCHWDGYLSGVGKVLLENYTLDVDKVEELMDGGDISDIGLDPSKCRKTHDTRACRDTHGSVAREFKTMAELIEYFKISWCDYLYVFNGRGWEYMTRDMDSSVLMVPSDVG